MQKLIKVNSANDLPELAKVPMFFSDNGKKVQTNSSAVVCRYGKELVHVSTVGDRYNLVQPREILQTFQDRVEEQGLNVSYCLFNPITAGLLIQAEVNTNNVIAGDRHASSLVFYTSHDKKHRTMLGSKLLRYACFNQVPLICKDAKNNPSAFPLSETHVSGNIIDAVSVEKALDLMSDATHDYSDLASTMKDTYMTADSLKTFIERYLYEKSKDNATEESKLLLENRNEKLSNNILNEWNDGFGMYEIADNTAWKALNALSGYYTRKTSEHSSNFLENKNIRDIKDTGKAIIDLKDFIDTTKEIL